MFFLQSHGRKFERLRNFESQLHLPRIFESQVRNWFGGVKGFPKVDQLASIAAHGAPVHVNGFGATDTAAALAYETHRSVSPYTGDIINKIHEDLRFGRAFVFPFRLVNEILGLRLSPLAVVESTSATHIIHDLTFATSPSCHGVNAETVATAPHVNRIMCCKMLYGVFCFCGENAVSVRIVLSEMDVEDAFRHVAVEWERPGRLDTYSAT